MSITINGTTGFSTDGGSTLINNATAAGDFTIEGALGLPAGTANGVAYLNGSKVLTSGSALTFDGTTFTSGAHTLSSGNLSFGTTGQRITGDFSNGTVANRVAFQTSTVNGNTVVNAIPNGTAQVGVFRAFNNSDPTNASYIQLAAHSGFTQISADITGTGTYLPMTFYTGGSERMRVDTSGNVGIGTSSPSQKLEVAGSAMFKTGADDYIHLLGDSGSMEIARAAGDAYIDFKNSAAEDYDCRIQSAGTGGTLTFSTAGSERARISSSGNVGIGTNDPNYRLDIAAADTTANFGYAMRLRSNATAGAATLQFTNDPVSQQNGSITVNNSYVMTIDSGTMVLSTGNTERARIDGSGNLLVGVTSVPANAGSGAGWITGAFNGALRSRTGTGTYSANGFSFYWNGNAQLWVDSTNVGNISISSDYRIKQKIETQNKPAIDRVMQLRPVTYELQDYGDLFKADGVAREGFIAHELQEVVPSAVEGEKDAPNQIQSLKLDALCSVMVKAIQEQQAIITQLQADVAALKGAA